MSGSSILPTGKAGASSSIDKIDQTSPLHQVDTLAPQSFGIEWCSCLHGMIGIIDYIDVLTKDRFSYFV